MVAARVARETGVEEEEEEEEEQRERERETGEGDLARRVIASENKSRRATECAHSLRHPGIEREGGREGGERERKIKKKRPN